jgi:hypothetical protein
MPSQPANVSFGNTGVDLHVFQVLGDLNNVGVLKLAVTVCPTSILRSMTVPSIGERMMVYCRLVFRDPVAIRLRDLCASDIDLFWFCSRVAGEMKPWHQILVALKVLSARRVASAGPQGGLNLGHRGFNQGRSSRANLPALTCRL